MGVPAAVPRRVGAVVLHYFAADDLQATLTALCTQEPAPEQVVVVDNGSHPGVLEDLLQPWAGIHTIPMPTNAGYAAGMNAGVAALGPEVDAVLLLTQDCRLAPGCLAALLDALALDGVGMVGPILHRRSTGEIWSAGGTLTRVTMWPGHRDGRSELEPAWLDGAALVLRREVYDDVGPLDEGYFLYAEDVELGVRVRAAGWRLLCATSATASQEPGSISVYAATRNHLRFVRRNGDRRQTIAALLRHSAYLVADIAGAWSSRRRARIGPRSLAIRHAFSEQLDLGPLLGGRAVATSDM